MTDPRIPDEAPRADDFDGLGLDSLSEGVHPTTHEWSTIIATATRRRQRRTWLLAVAAMIVVVVGTAAVVLSRTDDDSISISAGGLPAEARLLPPEDATAVTVVRILDGTAIFYTDDQGRPWVLRQGLPREALGFPGGAGNTYDTGVGGPGTVEIPPFGTVWLSCAGYWVSGDTTGTVISFRGPATAMFLLGSGAAFVAAPTEGLPADGECTVDDPVVDAVKGLRVVTVAEYDEFLGTVPVSTPEVSQTIVGGDIGGVVVPASTTTLPEDPPADRVSAEEQIGAAVAAWNEQAADGSFPNLEDGTAKAAEYADMFDTATKQSGAAQAGDGSGNRNAVTQVRFVSPERAAITMSLTAVLPTGTFTFPQDGEAILQDGRWVVTYRTVTTTLRRACIPPGGYDGCPSS